MREIDNGVNETASDMQHQAEETHNCSHALLECANDTKPQQLAESSTAAKLIDGSIPITRENREKWQEMMQSPRFNLLSPAEKLLESLRV